jgi:ATP-dependent DNA helicase RecQ
VTAAVNRLEQAGALEVLVGGDVIPAASAVDADAAVEAQEARREYERSRVAMIRAYAELRDCRREFLLNYFGEPLDTPCGFCDNCAAGLVAADGPQPFPHGARVAHEAWGTGTVHRYEADKLVVLFDEVGYKTLAVELVQERRLLESAE